MAKKKVLIVVGARPNFIKVSPLLREFEKYDNFFTILVHTGQHYDFRMSESFFNELNIQEPDIYLGVGSGTHAIQTGKIMTEFEKVCVRERPDLLIVVGDVNSTIACALVATKLFVQVVHIEAGLRSFDRTMPEEINRVLTDQISDYLFTTCKDANKNLEKEGILENKIFFVGNIMIDTLMYYFDKAEKSDVLERFSLKKNGIINKYAVLTLHRPSNVDDFENLKGIFTALNRLSEDIPIIFPAHPRAEKMIETFNLEEMVTFCDKMLLNAVDMTNRKLFLVNPLSYLDFMCLMSHASMVFTDSGGIQEETTFLGVPCLTLRNNTERPITVKEGTNIIVGSKPEKILRAAKRILNDGMSGKKIPEYWDGKAAERIIKILANNL